MQTVDTLFNQYAAGSVRPLSWALRISFDKAFDDSVNFFTLDSSLLDGGDLLAPSDDNPLQEWDFYIYNSFTDRLISVEWSREIEFPFSVSSAIADFKLDNHDDYFTPNGGSPIEDYIIPKRPLRILSGFNGYNIPQFVGLTESMPTITDKDKTADFHALDFLSELFTLPLNETVAMANVRTDEVLVELFSQFGLSPSQYNLAKGRNKIPFLFFERGTNAGEVIRALMQAEMGNLWLDEQGIIRFAQRLLPVDTPVMVFDDSNVIDISTVESEDIINKVIIHSEVRDVQEFQPVWTRTDSGGSTSNLLVIPANGTLVVEADLQDPCISAVDPTQGLASNVSWFVTRKSDGTLVSTDVDVIDSELRTNTFVMTFENNNAFPVEISEAEVWGEPAKIIDEIEYTAYESDSVDKYEEKVLTIDNNYLGNRSNCESLAYTILDGYSEYASVIEMTVKGHPALQLGDIITVDARSYNNDYQITKITSRLAEDNYEQVIRARLYAPREWFTLDQSLLDGTDVLAP